jgi:hypothetical protein
LRLSIIFAALRESRFLLALVSRKVAKQKKNQNSPRPRPGELVAVSVEIE